MFFRRGHKRPVWVGVPMPCRRTLALGPPGLRSFEAACAPPSMAPLASYAGSQGTGTPPGISRGDVILNVRKNISISQRRPCQFRQPLPDLVQCARPLPRPQLPSACRNCLSPGKQASCRAGLPSMAPCPRTRANKCPLEAHVSGSPKSRGFWGRRSPRPADADLFLQSARLFPRFRRAFAGSPGQRRTEPRELFKEP